MVPFMLDFGQAFLELSALVAAVLGCVASVLVAVLIVAKRISPWSQLGGYIAALASLLTAWGIVGSGEFFLVCVILSGVTVPSLVFIMLKRR